MTTKKVLNLHEEITHQRLLEICNQKGALVFAKVRVADVLAIEGSGISNSLFRFALQSHFDFVVTSSDHSPLFAVEFDGPSHDSTKQRARDRQKNDLCDRMSFPLLRINSRYLPRQFRNLDLLTWFVEIWFFQKAFAKCQEEGGLPADEICDPFSVITLPNRKEPFPLRLSAEVRVKIQEFHQAGECYDLVPSEWIGVDKEENYHGITWLRTSKVSGVFTRTGIRCQRFPMLEGELLAELLPFQLYEDLEAVIRAGKPAVPVSVIEDAVRSFVERYEMRSCTKIIDPHVNQSDREPTWIPDHGRE